MNQPLYIFHTVTLFSDDEVDKILKMSENYTSEPARVGSGEINGQISPDVRISDVKWLKKNDSTKWIYQKLYAKLKEINSKFYQFDLKGIENLQFTEYKGDSKGKYNSHVDTSSYYIDDEMYMRKLSVSILLTDQKEFTGGQLLINVEGSDVIPEHKKGQAIIFPSFLTHKVFPVTSGKRITLVAWVYGKKFV